MRPLLPALAVLCVITTGSGEAVAQHAVRLVNPSFEAEPQIGTSGSLVFPVSGWQNLSPFKNQSAPDIHGRHTNFWNVATLPADGDAFIGLVVRADYSWECIGQYLREPLQPETSYTLSLQLCHDKWFFGYQEPAIIRIWGSNKMDELEELLAESEPVVHPEWKEYVFDLIPSSSYKYLVIQAYFQDEDASPASGHVLVDLAKLNKL